jgi:hypothetical protein
MVKKLTPRQREIQITAKMIDGTITDNERKELQEIQMKRFRKDFLTI